MTNLVIKLMTALVWMVCCWMQQVNGQSREWIDFNKDWAFQLDSVSDYRDSQQDTRSWRKLHLPHDWSIEMPFDSLSAGSTGTGYLSGGVGWYKKEFILPKEVGNKRVAIHFGAIYENSTVWINDILLGHRPNGYLPITYDLTAHVYHEGRPNVITVKVDNGRQPNSRFYAGSGIYRGAALIFTDEVAIAANGTFFTTPVLTPERARVRAELELLNYNEDSEKKVTIETRIHDEDGLVVAKTCTDGMLTGRDRHIQLLQEMDIVNPKLWSPEHPHLYRAVTTIMDGMRELDRYETVLGIRSFTFDREKGFFLNGQPLKIRGVCMHSDLGSLGMAYHTSAARRQLQIMKDMGVNGIRTSHNPAAAEFLDLCDEMGFVVMNETFDVWKLHKNPFDYHLYWDDWHERDFIDHIKRDRNHPSLFVWCLGNEAQEQWHSQELGVGIPKRLAAIVDSLDGTRPTTIANNAISQDNPVLMTDAVDIVGYNYNHDKWKDFLVEFPDKKFIVTESTSALASRGQYDLVPIDSLRAWPARWDIPFAGGNADKSISAYDHVHTPWGSIHEESLRIFEENEHISGMYVWTGFDYLGEPTPYTWPARSSYFGIVDLAGFPKDVYYLYQSVWTDKPVLHLLPHWNWNEGDKVDVVAYYSRADEVELLLNGKSLGRRTKSDGKLHVKWTVPFEPGVLTAVAYTGGVEVNRTMRRTVGEAMKLHIKPDRQIINTAVDELAFLEVVALDEAGNEVALFNDKIQVMIDGAGKVVATDNGCPTDLTSFQSLQKNAYNGKLLIVVKGTEKGEINIAVESGELEKAVVTLNTQ